MKEELINDKELLIKYKQILNSQIYRVTAEKTMSTDIYVLAEDDKQAEKIARDEFDGYTDGDFDDGDLCLYSHNIPIDSIKGNKPWGPFHCNMTIPEALDDILSELSILEGLNNRNMEEIRSFLELRVLLQEAIDGYVDPNQMVLFEEH